jgi:hypothetical protein
MEAVTSSSCHAAGPLAGINELLPCPTKPNDRPRCEHQDRDESRDQRALHRWRAHTGVATVVNDPPQRPPLHQTRLAQTTKLGRRRLPRSVSYQLDTPTPPAVSHRWRRLVSGSVYAITSDPQPGNVRLMRGSSGAPPRRCRRGVISTDPTRQETPGTFGAQNAPNGLPSQDSSLQAKHPGNPEGPPERPQPRA